MGSALLAIAATVAVALMLQTQLSVTDEALGVTRACGSAFDGVVGRTGWETWWPADLDEPDSSVRASLVRTDRCPGRLNRQIALAAVLGATGALLGSLSWRRELDLHRSENVSEGVGRRLERLGTVGFAAGVLLTVAGVVGIVVLVADPDSTLFLYVDRGVVAIIGLVVLVPPMALGLIGKGLSIAGKHIENLEGPAAAEKPDP